MVHSTDGRNTPLYQRKVADADFCNWVADNPEPVFGEFLTFLLNKLSHLKQAYRSEEEFGRHLMSGEVTIPIPDLMNYVDEYVNGTLPSKHQEGDKVHLCLMPEDERLESFPALTAIVKAVHFYNRKVKYDLEIKFYGDMNTRIYNIDEMFVVKYKEKKVPSQH